MSEARFMKRKIIPGVLRTDDDSCALIIEYEVEAAILSDTGEVIRVERKQMEKTIKVSLTENSDISRLAQDIVDNSTQIPQSMIENVEQQLLILQNRQLMQDYSTGDAHMKGKKGKKRKKKKKEDDLRNSEAQDNLDASMLSKEKPSIHKLDVYMEMLYEDVEKKIVGAYLISQLAQVHENLETLIGDEPLLGALSRTLREDGQRSIELVMHIVNIFFIFSNYSQFHAYISNHRVGEYSMKVMETETKRLKVYKRDLKKMEKELRPGDDQGRMELEKEKKKVKLMTKKQDKLLCVCTHLLLNLAENLDVEKKMNKKNISKYLTVLLERRNPDLLMLVITFLKKLSIFRENHPHMLENNVMTKLAGLVPVDHQQLQDLTLHLMFNLAFDPFLRAQLVIEGGIVPKLNEMLMDEEQPPEIVLKLLYIISMDDACKNLLKDSVPLLIRMILEYPEQLVGKELAAVTINLACNAKCAAIMTQQEPLQLLMKRTFATQDELLMKVIRNLSMHSVYKSLFLNFTDDFLNMVRQTPSEDMVVEVLGILGGLPLYELRLESMVKDHRIMDFLVQLLSSGGDDDLALEVIIFMGQISRSEYCCKLMSKYNLVQMLWETMDYGERKNDNEIVLQALFAFHFMVKVEDSRDQLCSIPGFIDYMVDFVHDAHPLIRKYAERILNEITEGDQVEARKVRNKRYHVYNSEWLDVADMGYVDDVGSYDDYGNEYGDDYGGFEEDDF
eukprot:TRINITY_DN1560_c0_g1_i1.p1 TRINITY_DN1560_c0_g1~~TRINITY_DN1560_c0_g1_i1.p1  ORF type:complete len:731 (+),score=286.23 TRINITY_DN1560_c0_g1_i1:26-2218(+)